MRIYFGLFHNRTIKWPPRCAWCESEATHWHKYKKKTIYDFRFKIIWFEILSKAKAISYPVCLFHNIIAHILRPSRLIIGFFIINLFILPALNFNRYIIWIANIFIIFGAYYFWKRGVILHKVYSNHIELSIPDGKYSEEFGLLNECRNIERHVLMQD